MGYERYPRDHESRGDDYGRSEARRYRQDDRRDGAPDRYEPSRYAAGGRDGNEGRQGYGPREYGYDRYDARDQQQGARDHAGGRGAYGDTGQHSYGQRRYGPSDGAVERSRYGADAGRDHHGYGADRRAFEDYASHRHADDDRYRNRDRYQSRDGQQGHGRQPQGYDYDDRGFFARAGDEVRSWFGDEEAERRREYDSRMDERAYAARDHDYHHWRQSQIQSLDRDYDEYRREHRSKFDNEFSAWRSVRQTQRDALHKVEEHMEVIGSDGEHVGTVDKVRGDRIVLTRTDAEAGGRHHSIPSSWLQIVEGKVTLRKSAAEAKATWRDEERQQARSDGDFSRAATEQRGTTDQPGTTSNAASSSSSSTSEGGTSLNRSFSGTY